MTDKTNTALAALSDVLTELLATDEPNRFARVAKVAHLTQSIAVQLRPPRVNDAKQLAMPLAEVALQHNIYGNPGYDTPEYTDADGNGYLQMNPMGPAVGVVRPAPLGLNNQQDQIRQVMMAVQGPLEQQRQARASRVRENQASELNALLAARADTSPAQAAIINRRIDALLQLIDQPDTKEQANAADVVPTELLRGHPTGADGAGAHPGNDLQSDASGEAGDAGAAPGSGEDSSGGTVLAPARVPPFRSRLDAGAEPRATSTDLEGAEAPAEAAQAGPGLGDGGALRQRQGAGDDGAAAGATGGIYNGLIVGADGKQRATWLREDGVRIYRDGSPV